MMTPEQRYVRDQLKKAFDKTFDAYCTALTRGVKAKIFVIDTDENRALLEEFKNYVQQRAQFEGWGYTPENLEIFYVSEDKLPSDRTTVLANPLNQNVGFEEVRDDIFIRMKQEDANRVRDRGLSIVLEYQRKR